MNRYDIFDILLLVLMAGLFTYGYLRGPRKPKPDLEALAAIEAIHAEESATTLSVPRYSPGEPAGWPLRWTITPVYKPHEPGGDIEEGYGELDHFAWSITRVMPDEFHCDTKIGLVEKGTPRNEVIFEGKAETKREAGDEITFRLQDANRILAAERAKVSIDIDPPRIGYWSSSPPNRVSNTHIPHPDPS